MKYVIYYTHEAGEKHARHMADCFAECNGVPKEEIGVLHADKVLEDKGRLTTIWEMIHRISYLERKLKKNNIIFS